MSTSSPSSTHIYQSFPDESTTTHVDELQRPFLRRLWLKDKKACFTLWVIIAAIVCLIGCILGIVFLPVEPSYSLCNENIHWNSILNSILKLGYTQANVTIHASLYNPNRFDIELKHLDLTMYYKGEYFGNAKISHDQTRITFRQEEEGDLSNHDQASTYPIPTIPTRSLPHYTPDYSSGLDDWDTQGSGGDGKEMVNNGQVELVITTTSNNPHHPQAQTNLPPAPTPTLTQIESQFELDQRYQSLQTLSSHQLGVPKPVTLKGGSITDVFLDAIIEPTMTQASLMLLDWTSSSLFISVQCHYDTSVFVWYTPRINYNATTTFDNIDVMKENEVNYCLCKNTWGWIWMGWMGYGRWIVIVDS